MTEKAPDEVGIAGEAPSGWVVDEPRRLPWYVYIFLVIPLIAVGACFAIGIAAVVFFGLIYGW